MDATPKNKNKKSLGVDRATRVSSTERLNHNTGTATIIRIATMANRAGICDGGIKTPDQRRNRVVCEFTMQDRAVNAGLE